MKVAQTFNTGRKDILCKDQGEYNQFKRSSAEKKNTFMLHRSGKINFYSMFLLCNFSSTLDFSVFSVLTRVGFGVELCRFI